MSERLILKLYKEWVKGKVYKDVADNPRKYREFCALVSFTQEDGETKTYLPYSRSSDVSFKVSDIKVGDILYMGYVNGYKNRTLSRTYCKVVENKLCNCRAEPRLRPQEQGLHKGRQGDHNGTDRRRALPDKREVRRH